MKKKAEKFKIKGTNILKEQQTRPNSMKDFLNDPLTECEKDTQPHKNIIPQLHKITNPQKHNALEVEKEELGRLHIQIRQDLLDRLLDIVFKRKRNPKIRNQIATQRAIIEEALENYFKNEKNISTDKA
jgi:hypothetical protein